MHKSNIETVLATERPRLVRLCGRLSGNWEAAEDLAQETLLRAWHQSNRPQEASQLPPWLAGIARNVCLEWSRRYYREQNRLAQTGYSASAGAINPADQLSDDVDLEFELEREELVTLLDQALALLPPETRAILVQKYVEESPYSEIAQRLGLSENVIAVRAHRGKLAFQRVLSNQLQAEAVEYGLINNESDTWETTRLWCPWCGKRHLSGRFQKDVAEGVFELRCPTCNDGTIASGADLSIPFFTDLLGKLKTFKPAYIRLLTTMGNYCRQTLESQATSCLVCGGETSIWYGEYNHTKRDDNSQYGVRVFCQACHWGTNYALDSFALITPEAQQFWRSHPRLRILPTREIQTENAPALLIPIRSTTSGAGLDVLFLRDTFEIISVHKTAQ